MMSAKARIPENVKPGFLGKPGLFMRAGRLHGKVVFAVRVENLTISATKLSGEDTEFREARVCPDAA